MLGIPLLVEVSNFFSLSTNRKFKLVIIIEIFSFNLGITQLLVQPVTNRLVAIETLSSADERHSISVALIFDVDAAPPTCRAVRLPVPILRTSLLESGLNDTFNFVALTFSETLVPLARLS